MVAWRQHSQCPLCILSGHSYPLPPPIHAAVEIHLISRLQNLHSNCLKIHIHRMATTVLQTLTRTQLCLLSTMAMEVGNLTEICAEYPGLPGCPVPFYWFGF